MPERYRSPTKRYWTLEKAGRIFKGMPRSDARKPRVLILSDLPPTEAKRRSETERFASLARALARGGLEAEHAFAGDEAALGALLAATKPDLAFSAALMSAPEAGAASGPGPRGRRNMHELLEEAGVPYVGSEPAVLELAIDKAALKERWREAGVASPAFLSLHPGEALDEARARALGFPCIVKPSREGNSRGLGEDSVVRDLPSLRKRVEAAARDYGAVLVERFLGDFPDIREFTAALLGSGPGALVLPVEIKLSSAKAVRLVTTEDKDGHRTAALPIDDAALRARVAAFARRAFAAAGTRDYARCDLLLAGGEIQAIEINGQPMLPDLWFEACCATAGLGAEAYPNAVFLAALARLARSPGTAFPRIPDAMRDIVPAPVYEALAGQEA